MSTGDTPNGLFDEELARTTERVRMTEGSIPDSNIIDLDERRIQKSNEVAASMAGLSDEARGVLREASRQPRKVLPSEYYSVLNRPSAVNGLPFAEWKCEACDYHLSDQAILLGVVRKKCPRCKYPNVREFNRVGELEMLDFKAQKAVQEQLEAARGAQRDGTSG